MDICEINFDEYVNDRHEVVAVNLRHIMYRKLTIFQINGAALHSPANNRILDDRPGHDARKEKKYRSFGHKKDFSFFVQVLTLLYLGHKCINYNLKEKKKNVIESTVYWIFF